MTKAYKSLRTKGLDNNRCGKRMFLKMKCWGTKGPANERSWKRMLPIETFRS